MKSHFSVVDCTPTACARSIK